MVSLFSSESSHTENELLLHQPNIGLRSTIYVDTLSIRTLASLFNKKPGLKLVTLIQHTSVVLT